MKPFLFTITMLYISLFLGYSQQKSTNKKMNTALILIDIQNDYFENGKMPLAGSSEASLNARQVLDHFRSEGWPVIYIQHIASRPNSTFFLPQTKGAEIHDNIKPKENEKVVIKHFPNSFRETALLEYLKINNITNLVICGMMTHMCVDATVRAASDFGFNCTLISDACATRDLEINGEVVKAAEVQKSFLAALSGFYASVITTPQYLLVKD
jgi:nicotinamidase-related amidase